MPERVNPRKKPERGLVLKTGRGGIKIFLLKIYHDALVEMIKRLKVWKGSTRRERKVSYHERKREIGCYMTFLVWR